MDRAAALSRVEALRAHLQQSPEPRLAFSCGVAELAPGGSAHAALLAADRAMYDVKPREVVQSPS
jgi:PleD family two-component response regulator